MLRLRLPWSFCAVRQRKYEEGEFINEDRKTDRI